VSPPGTDQRPQLLLDELVHHLEPDADREGEQPLPHRAGEVVERKLNLARQAQPVQLVVLDDPGSLILLHLAVLLLDWTPSPPALATGGDGGPPFKIHNVRDML